MSRKSSTLALSLTEAAHARLSALARSRTAPAHHVERSAIILHLRGLRRSRDAAAFSKVARSVLRRIGVASKAELGNRIRRYIEACNATPGLPNWRYGTSPEPQPQAA